jgi:hypothetical protein
MAASSSSSQSSVGISLKTKSAIVMVAPPSSIHRFPRVLYGLIATYLPPPDLWDYGCTCRLLFHLTANNNCLWQHATTEYIRTTINTRHYVLRGVEDVIEDDIHWNANDDNNTVPMPQTKVHLSIIPNAMNANGCVWRQRGRLIGRYQLTRGYSQPIPIVIIGAGTVGCCLLSPLS